MKKYLCTIIAPTNRPKKFVDLIRSVDLTTSDQNKILIVAAVDDEYTKLEIENFLSNWRSKVDVAIHYFKNQYGQYGVFKGINSAINEFKDTQWYQITSDDIQYIKLNWDKKLESISNFDNEFCRIKASSSRFYYIKKSFDCIAFPDCFPYLNFKYLDSIKTAGNCYGSDTFFEGISYYLSDLTLSSNPLRQKRFNIDVIIDEPFYRQPDFGTDLSEEHKDISTLLMYLEWFRLLSTSYQNNLIKYALIIAENILIKEGYKKVFQSHNYIKYKNCGNNILLRKNIRISEFITNKFTQTILIYLILKQFISLLFINSSDKLILLSIYLLKNIKKIPEKIEKLKNKLKKILLLIGKFLPNFLKNRVKSSFIKSKRAKLLGEGRDSSMPVAIFLHKHIFGIFIVNCLQKKYNFLTRFKGK